MSADSDKIAQAWDDQLSNLDKSIDASAGDVEMLAEIQQGIGHLMAENGNNEGEIRRVLQERFDKGNLRKETYQLVKSMLDQFEPGNEPAVAAPAKDEPLSLVESDEPEADASLSLVESGEPEKPNEPGAADEPLSLEEPEKPVEPSPAAIAKKTAVKAKPVAKIKPKQAAKPKKAAKVNKPVGALELIASDEPEKPVEPAKPAAAEKADELDSTAIIPNEMLRPPTADDRVQAGSVLRDRFLLQERVSGGNIGVVFRAMDRRLAEAAVKSPFVAIKVLSPLLLKSATALRMLQQQIEKSRRLAHPGIARILDLDRDDDLNFVVSEWLVGRTLGEMIDSPDAKKNISAERAVEIACEVGEALEYAHSCGMVHADINPGNVMMLATGEMRVFDFGVARALKSQTGENVVDPGILAAISTEYSSMQVLTGERPVPSDDVFSLGCLLYRLIAGYRVFGPRDAAEAAADGMKPQRLKGIPKYQWAAIKKAMSYSRVTRFATMQEFLDALQKPGIEEISIDPDEVVEIPKKSGAVRGLLGLLALLVIFAGAEYQFGVVDIVRSYIEPPAPAPVVRDLAAERSADRQAEALQEIANPFPVKKAPERDVEATVPADDVVDAAAPAEAQEDTVVPAVDTGVDTTLPEVAIAEEPVAPTVDFSSLPPADYELALSSYGASSVPLALTIREDSDDVVIDLLRFNAIEQPMELRIEEVSYSGNRSPWATGQFEISNDGFVSIFAGQDRARVTLSMANDPLREADQQSTLLIRNSDSTNVELAKIEILIEDDDQRQFEARLPRNTIAFAVSQVSVGEQDPAAQIDILRFNPDVRSIEIAYTVSDVTATEGEDYFSPGSDTISFEPGQRSARILIPLVQDAVVEGDESFSVRLITRNAGTGTGVYQRIVVMIRDDDIPGR